jgi:hypothetical protein
MPKLAFYSSLVIGALLSITTIYLIAVNWTPKVVQPLLSVFFGAIVTAFITVSFILKQTTISESFPVYVVLNKQNNLPAGLLPDIAPPGFAMMSLHAGMEKIKRDKPVKQERLNLASPDEKFNFYGELIQYELVSRLFSIFFYKSAFVSHRSATQPATVSLELFETKHPKRFTKIGGKTVIKALSRNQFLQPSEWDYDACSIPVPYKTAIRIPDSHRIILERPGYYRVTIKTEPIAAADGAPAYLLGALIPGLIGKEGVETLGFKMTTEAVFEKFTSGSPYSEETMDWVRSLFDRLRSEFSESRKDLHRSQ